jgi:hypothetical protein
MEEILKNSHSDKHVASGKSYLIIVPERDYPPMHYSREIRGSVLLCRFLMAYIKLKKAIFPPNLSGVVFPDIMTGEQGRQVQQSLWP